MPRDPYTMQHLEKWLDAHVNGDTCRDECRAAMLAIFDEDPEYWSGQEWTNLFDRAKCGDIQRKYLEY